MRFCLCCRRRLKNEKSIVNGYGSCCFKIVCEQKVFQKRMSDYE